MHEGISGTEFEVNIYSSVLNEIRPIGEHIFQFRSYIEDSSRLEKVVGEYNKDGLLYAIVASGPQLFTIDETFFFFTNMTILHPGFSGEHCINLVDPIPFYGSKGEFFNLFGVIPPVSVELKRFDPYNLAGIVGRFFNHESTTDHFHIDD